MKLKALESDNDQNNGIQLIPDKNSRFTLDATDSLIVVAENEL